MLQPKQAFLSTHSTKNLWVQQKPELKDHVQKAQQELLGCPAATQSKFRYLEFRECHEAIYGNK